MQEVHGKTVAPCFTNTLKKGFWENMEPLGGDQTVLLTALAIVLTCTQHWYTQMEVKKMKFSFGSIRPCASSSLVPTNFTCNTACDSMKFKHLQLIQIII